MNATRIFSFLLFASFSIAGLRAAAAQMECRCHSKNPLMKRMHETIGFTDCGNCHSREENLMSRRNNPVKEDPPKIRLKKRISEDRFCIPCHGSDGSVKKEMVAGVSKMSISGTLYCAKDKMRFPAGTRFCPKCGSSLININESMAKSRTNPSNAICIECHSMTEVYTINKHGIFNAEKLKMCLDCHKGHDDCGSCHR